MKPQKYPYSGKVRLVSKELPRLIMLKHVAFNSNLIKHIEIVHQVGQNDTLVCLKIPKFLGYEEKQIKVQMKLHQVVKILNQYK